MEPGWLEKGSPWWICSLLRVFWVPFLMSLIGKCSLRYCYDSCPLFHSNVPEYGRWGFYRLYLEAMVVYYQDPFGVSLRNSFMCLGKMHLLPLSCLVLKSPSFLPTLVGVHCIYSAPSVTLSLGSNPWFLWYSVVLFRPMIVCDAFVDVKLLIGKS